MPSFLDWLRPNSKEPKTPEAKAQLVNYAQQQQIKKNLKQMKDAQGNPIPDIKGLGLNASSVPLLSSTSGNTNIFGGGGDKKKSSSYDPIASQLQFMQMVQPFIQAGVQEAVRTLQQGAQGLAKTADMYGQYGISGGEAQAQNIRNEGVALAEKAAVAPQYEMFMQLLNMLREEQAKRYEENALFQAQLNAARQQGSTAAPGNSFQMLQQLLEGGIGGR